MGALHLEGAGQQPVVGAAWALLVAEELCKSIAQAVVLDRRVADTAEEAPSTQVGKQVVAERAVLGPAARSVVFVGTGAAVLQDLSAAR